MKLTNTQLRQIIKEELESVLGEGKDKALKMAREMKAGSMGMILGDGLEEVIQFITNDEKEKALEEIGYMYEGTETAGQDELVKKLERLVKQM